MVTNSAALILTNISHCGKAANLLLPLIYPFIRDGRFKSRLLQNASTQRKSEMGGYVQAFMEMLAAHDLM